MTTPHIEQPIETPAQPSILRIPKTRVGKVLFSLAIIAWFGVLLLPLGCFFLATSGQVRLGQAVPDSDTHPLFQISLIMDADQRGLQFVRSVVASQSENMMCLETSVNYVLWQSTGADVNVAYCDCYERQAKDQDWQLTSSIYQACGAKQ